MGHTHDLITSTHNIHMLQMLQGHVSSKDAHEMMMLMVMLCYDHAQMMLKCKANTWGVTGGGGPATARLHPCRQAAAGRPGAGDGSTLPHFSGWLRHCLFVDRVTF
jgi:hypothetical protein